MLGIHCPLLYWTRKLRVLPTGAFRLIHSPQAIGRRQVYYLKVGFHLLSVLTFKQYILPVQFFTYVRLYVQVPSSKTLITPVQCKSLWRQFTTETEYSVTQAIAAQVRSRSHSCPRKSLIHLYYLLLLNCQAASRQNNNWLPPPWAIVAFFVLGFNEFMALLRYLMY